tara:strand:+ start:535 stop:1005 length:471 start_codon:yes stop_codon:yes gene_type:complete
MPQGGSFPNIPDTPIGGDILVELNALPSSQGGTSDWSCSKVVASADSASFQYIFSGNSSGTATATDYLDTFALPTKGFSFDMVIDPKRVIAATGVFFLCNSCDCDEPMTGTTAYDETGYGYIVTATTVTQAGATATNINPNTAFAPTIIGGEGLNN